MISKTEDRVPSNTRPEINHAVRQEMTARMADCAAEPDAIPHRLDELDREWDIERTLEANAAAIALAGLALGAFVSRRFLVLPAVVAAFLLQHAVQGWCPPVPLLRRLRFRTAREIDSERTALKALRGDFRGVANSPNAALEATIH